jgi:hypothetical protein
MNLRDPYGEQCRKSDERMAIERDAERYRWLRDRAGNVIMLQLMAECRPDEWDRLVDRAMQSEGKTRE